MAAGFIFLKNEGSPTRWDGTRYFEYLKSIRRSLPEDLLNLTVQERYALPSYSDLSFWHSEVTHLDAHDDIIHLAAKNDYGNRRFEFSYTGVKKVQSTRLKFRARPWLVMQELVLMPNGLFRHSYSDIRGDFFTIYATSMTFSESVLQ